MKREEVLNAAAKCVNGDRQEDYGKPEHSFDTIAALWNAYLTGKGNNQAQAIDAKDVACMLALLKIARISTGHGKSDNWIDLAGYAACGGEIQSLMDAAAKKRQLTSTVGSGAYADKRETCFA